MSGNIAQLLARRIDDPGQVLYRHFADGDWRDVCVAEVASLAGRWQAAFRRDGLIAGDRIAPCAKNGVNWVVIVVGRRGSCFRARIFSRMSNNAE